jgi:hypothetical protein
MEPPKGARHQNHLHLNLPSSESARGIKHAGMEDEADAVTGKRTRMTGRG